ncbi:MAG: Lar family restriction alleviation protein [Nitrosomonas sp.]|nr:Lar family restriction alleviation protein [Nitrosomonas sp.]
MSESLEELLPCPFCGAGETHIVENGKRWLGMEWSEPISVSVRHWCTESPGPTKPNRMIERIGRDRQRAIEQWNMRCGVIK